MKTLKKENTEFKGVKLKNILVSLKGLSKYIYHKKSFVKIEKTGKYYHFKNIM